MMDQGWWVAVGCLIVVALLFTCVQIIHKEKTELQETIEERNNRIDLLILASSRLESSMKDYKQAITALRDKPDLMVEEVTITFYAPLDPNAVEGMCYSGDPTVTASGAKSTPGITIAADPSIPFGTLVWIEDFGYRVVQDRGGSIKGNRIDIMVDTKKEALELGRKIRTAVFFMEKGSN